MNAVELDADSELFRAAYDSDRDSTSVAVVAVVATALDRDPLELRPLQFAIDTSALEELSSGPTDGVGVPDETSFRYEGFEVTVSCEGTIEAVPTEGG